MRQLTVKAALLGIVLSAVLAGANAYLGLFAGLTVSASIPASVISMAVLKFFKDSNILENNVVQTAASAGESLAAGAIFTFPALVILGYWSTFDYVWVTMIAGIGGLLGVLFTIPLRRPLIVEEQLAYPEGTATAEVLRAGSGRGEGAKRLGIAALIGALVKLVETGFRLWPATAQSAAYVGPGAIAYVGTNLSPALISVGYIVGINIALLVFLGGVISWWIAIPVYSTFFLAGNPALSSAVSDGMSAADLAGEIWTSQIRYLGVGAMLVGGVWALVSMRSSIVAGIRRGLVQHAANDQQDHTERDAPMRWVLSGIALLVLPIAILYYAIVPMIGVALAMTLVMVAAGFLFSAVAGYMSGLVGASNNPVSGITIATILFTALMLLGLLGGADTTGPAAAILVGAVVCCAAAIGSDNLQDLKAGYLLGATPWRQQVMQGVGVIAAAFVMAPILNLLLQAYGIGAPSDAHPNALLAPQATLMASVAEGVFGAGLPWGMVEAGALIGLAIIALDELLRARGSTWRAPVLAVAVGIYLPLELSVPICAGGLIAHFANRSKRGADERKRRGGMLFAAGLITGEALVGILMAIPIVVSRDPDVIALDRNWPVGIGLAVVAGVGALLAYVAATDKGVSAETTG